MSTVRRALESLRLPAGLQSERVQWLADGAKFTPTAATDESAESNRRCLLYWMQTSVRAKHNYALEFAVAAANALQLPLRVVFLLPDRSVAPSADGDGEWRRDALQDANAHGFATERHAQFALEGLADAHRRLASRGVGLDVLHHHHDRERNVTPTRAQLLARFAQHAALVVTDRPYLRPWRAALDELAENQDNKTSADSSFGVVQVEGDVVVPVEVASSKEEYAARTIRPRITKHLERFLVPLERLELASELHTAGSSLLYSLDGSLPELESLDVSSSEAVAATLQKLDVDRNVESVAWRFQGGETQASACATRFLTADKLESYATKRNEPSLDAGSDLSLYLRFGHISVVRVALAAKKLQRVARAKAGLASFLEELIVRRELAVNLVAFNQADYDSMRCLPTYAQITLAEHAQDPRKPIYSRRELEEARTGDRFWNAAQRQLLVTGHMHGYMRMYWGKKLLEWTRTPREGFEAALVLNNKYALDAPDANSYAGVAWTFGKHDQGWKERPVFGKVRYMNEAGLKRKFRMDAYVLKVERLAAEAAKNSSRSPDEIGKSTATTKRGAAKSLEPQNDDAEAPPIASIFKKRKA